MVAHARAAVCDATGDRVIWAEQETQEEGMSQSPPPDLLTRADQLAACGEGQLIVLASAGQGAVQAGPAVSLIVYREPGEVENDPTARQHGVQTIVDAAFAKAQMVRPPGSGRDVIGLLAAIASERGPGNTDVWLQTLGLPTVNPANARELMAADPAQAVASIARSVPALPGVRVHLVLSPPAGDQPRFNTVTDAWRRQFMVALLRQAVLSVVTVTEVETVETPAPEAPAAPVIPNLPESTPQLPQPRRAQPYTARLDSSALFVPNTAQFLTSEAEVLNQLQPIITGWKRGLFSRATVVGHCARYGPPLGAVQLSEQRAAKIRRPAAAGRASPGHFRLGRRLQPAPAAEPAERRQPSRDRHRIPEDLISGGLKCPDSFTTYHWTTRTCSGTGKPTPSTATRSPRPWPSASSRTQLPAAIPPTTARRPRS